MANRKLAGIAHTPHELGIIARADRLTALLFLGRGNKHRIECATEAEARVAAERLADEHGRGAMLYAVAGAVVGARLYGIAKGESRELKQLDPSSARTS